MTKAAQSLFFFGIYGVAAGALFIALPGIMSLLQLPPLASGWARVVGLLALIIGTYDIVGARAECMPYIRASVLMRLGFAVGITLLVILGEMPVSAIPLGAVDAAGALWTALALKSQGQGKYSKT